MTVDPVRRLEWLRALRRFKYGIRVRAKLGVVDAICKQVAKERGKALTWDSPQWTHEKWVSYLYTCIRDNEFPHELLLGFVKTAEVTILSPHLQPTVDGVLIAVDVVLKQLSRQLRERFGVFDGGTQ